MWPSKTQSPSSCVGSMDEINHPTNYTGHPAGVECVDIAELLSFNLGNAMKCIWRAGLKTPDAIKDLKKAEWYVQREIKRLGKLHGQVDYSEKQREVGQTVANGARKASG